MNMNRAYIHMYVCMEALMFVYILLADSQQASNTSILLSSSLSSICMLKRGSAAITQVGA
jgi:hypothetical protein